MHTRVSISDNVWYTSNILLTKREKQDVIGIHGKIKKTQNFLKIKKRPKVSCLTIKANVFVSVFLLLSTGIYKTGMSTKNIYVYMYVYISCLLKKSIYYP